MGIPVIEVAEGTLPPGWILLVGSADGKIIAVNVFKGEIIEIPPIKVYEKFVWVEESK